jgi:hypothetical protein
VGQGTLGGPSPYLFILKIVKGGSASHRRTVVRVDDSALRSACIEPRPTIFYGDLRERTGRTCVSQGSPVLVFEPSRLLCAPHQPTGDHMDMSDLISAVAGFAAGFSLRFVIDRRKTDKSSNTGNQSHSTVKGNQVGRDYNIGPREP